MFGLRVENNSCFVNEKMMIERYFNPLWRRILKFDWRFGLLLLLVVCITRFALVLDANVEANYSIIGYLMVASAVIPFVFLSRGGLREIGIRGAEDKIWLLYSPLLGIAAASLLFAVGYLLYGYGIENWFVYIGNSYNIPEGVVGRDKIIYFVIFALTGMTFSPIGEELFFRGIVHSSFKQSVGERAATVIDGVAFALTHLSHFGIVYTLMGWAFLPLPAFIWVVSMFLLSLIFNMCKRKSGSLLGAVLCHSGFNLGMIFYIIYYLN